MGAYGATPDECNVSLGWRGVAYWPAGTHSFFFLAGVVAYVPIEEPENEWHKDLTVVSRVAEPPRLLAASRPSQV